MKLPGANDVQAGAATLSGNPHRPKIPGRAERGRRGCQQLPGREICKLLTRPHDTRLTAPLSRASRRRRRARERRRDRENPLTRGRVELAGARGCELELAGHSRPRRRPLRWGCPANTASWRPRTVHELSRAFSTRSPWPPNHPTSSSSVQQLHASHPLARWHAGRR